MSDDPLMDLCRQDPEVVGVIRGAVNRALIRRLDVDEIKRTAKVFIGNFAEMDDLRGKAFEQFVRIYRSANDPRDLCELLGPYYKMPTSGAEPEEPATVPIPQPPCLDHG